MALEVLQAAGVSVIGGGRKLNGKILTSVTVLLDEQEPTLAIQLFARIGTTGRIRSSREPNQIVCSRRRRFRQTKKFVKTSGSSLFSRW